jgi:hypothetical protein
MRNDFPISKSSVRPSGTPTQLPDDELSESVEYTDGSDDAFLRRLRHDLYGDEPLSPREYAPVVGGSWNHGGMWGLREGAG